MKVRNMAMQGQKFLCPSWFLEAQLTLLLFSGLAVGLSNQVMQHTEKMTWMCSTAWSLGKARMAAP